MHVSHIVQHSTRLQISRTSIINSLLPYMYTAPATSYQNFANKEPKLRTPNLEFTYDTQHSQNAATRNNLTHAESALSCIVSCGKPAVEGFGLGPDVVDEVRVSATAATGEGHVVRVGPHPPASVTVHLREDP